MTQVVPAIIPESYESLIQSAERVKDVASLVQVDILDGAYAPVTTWPFNEGTGDSFEKLRAGELKLPFNDMLHYEADLMVRAPEVTLDAWIQAGFSHLIIHIESTEHIDSIIARLRAAGRGVGLALRPSTPNEVLEPWIPLIDFVQFMGNDKIGFHGVSLAAEVLGKIRDLRSRHRDLIIATDIGVNVETAPELVKAGVNKLVSGSALFDSDDLVATYKQLSSLS